MSALCIALALAGCASTAGNDKSEARLWRAVLVGTADAVPVARVIDVAEEELVKEFKLDSVSNIRPGRHAHEWLLVSREPGAVRTLHTGMREEDHGDHKHWMAKAPELSEPLVWGKRPSHANAGGNRVAAFFDGDGVARVFQTNDAKKEAVVGELNSGKSHHGIAVPLSQRGRLLLSRPAPEGTLPLGVNLVESNGQIVIPGPDCPRQHGDAAHQGMIYFGCAAHLVVFSEAQSNFRVVNYPIGTPPEKLVRNIVASALQPQLLADFGPNGLLVIDSRSMGMKPVDLAAKRLHFTWDRAAPRYAFALTDDGRLHRVDTHSGKIETQAAVMPAWTEALSVKKTCLHRAWPQQQQAV
ncbi:MAG: hypothetical protein HC765_06240 [Brachymonas sp.]|nr:hypothetical protein [Brachymonas sp.]